jgi:murein DD-endopeptidase MepM/ murein hydrolase activator NlpD
VPLEDLLEINGLPATARLEPGQVVYLLEASPGGGGWEEPSATVTSATSPMVWPLREPRLTSTFGQRLGRNHEGIDLAAPTGTPIVAAREGYVLYAGDGVRGYGNMVVLQHGGDLLTVYAHNSVVLVRTGDRVVQGQEIARVGQSGRATAPHLHFEVRQGEHPRDPLTYLPPLP